MPPSSQPTVRRLRGGRFLLLLPFLDRLRPTGTRAHLAIIVSPEPRTPRCLVVYHGSPQPQPDSLPPAA